MTKKELSQLYFLNREIERDQKKLQELTAAAEGKAVLITGMPKGTDISDTIGNFAAEIADLKSIIELNIQRCWFELNRLHRYIDSVDDSQMRMILTLRYINGLSWNQVAASIGGGNTEDSVRMAHNRFLKER